MSVISQVPRCLLSPSLSVSLPPSLSPTFPSLPSVVVRLPSKRVPPVFISDDIHQMGVSQTHIPLLYFAVFLFSSNSLPASNKQIMIHGHYIICAV